MDTEWTILRGAFMNPQQMKPQQTKSTLLDQLNSLRNRPAGWNGYDAKPKVIKAAIEWLTDWMGDLATVEENFRQAEIPHVTSSAVGEVILEWWNGNRELVVYVRPKNPYWHLYYVQYRATNRVDKGYIGSESDWYELWNWLWEK